MPLFVIQKHYASHLHYDFRLEHGGVLLSWAVPKRPVAKLHEKRLAIQVEDHALSYGKFEGVIPKGEYGAGRVEIWDRGRYTVREGSLAQQMKKGHIKIRLQGKRLKGNFDLIRFKGKKMWLLMKTRET